VSEYPNRQFQEADRQRREQEEREARERADAERKRQHDEWMEDHRKQQERYRNS